ncbi:TonB-dependent receptor [Ruegeria sp.]|uniref:TonB-dependent receptor domain-containing protein n=1 Tax=Ruegeria sp. TaxID=1879320 RepID=UPI0023089CF5|nr:TonB-dependent receptor [Ruegeria sp.]MDA7964892.1 TonB-dependent receptor [Ruegeria sp.]
MYTTTRMSGLRPGHKAATKTNRFVLAVVAGLTAASSVAAQDAEITELEDIVVTASGTPTEVRKAPASISVITAEEIAGYGTNNLSEVLARSVGVTIERSANLNKVQLRGLGERYTLILIDGQRVNSDPNLFRGNDFDLDWVDIETVERVEIVRGPMSSLYGADAIGGVINIITKEPENVLSGSITGSYTLQDNPKAGDAYRTGLTLTGPINDHLSFRLSGGYTRREADDADINPPRTSSNRPPSTGIPESKNRYFDGTLAWEIDGANRLDFNYGYSKRQHAEVPMTRNDANITYFGNHSFGDSEVRLWTDQIKNEVGVSGSLGNIEPNTSRSYGLDGKITTVRGANALHNLTIGTSFESQSLDDPFNLTGDGTTSNWEAAIFAEDRIEFSDRLEVTFGARLDHHEKYGTNFSPRIYGVYELSDEWIVKGGVSTGFKAPTLLETSPNWTQISCGGGCYLVGSEDLEAETSINAEIGVSYATARVNFDATLFENRIKNMIQFPPARTFDTALAPTYDNFVGFAGDGNPMFTYQNLERVTTRGLELAFSTELTSTVSLSGNYTYLDAKVTESVERPLTYQPDHTINLRADWAVNDKLLLSVAGNYVSEQYTWIPDSGALSQATTVDAIATADLLAQYDITDSVTMYGGILNVTNNTLIRTDAFGDDFNTEGRRYFLTVTKRF